MHTCIYIYIHTHTHIYIYMYIYIHMYIYIYIYVCIYIYIYVCVCVCVCICMYFSSLHPDPALEAEPKGCQALKNKFDCLSSVDGSDVVSFGGIKIKGARGLVSNIYEIYYTYVLHIYTCVLYIPLIGFQMSMAQ